MGQQPLSSSQSSYHQLEHPIYGPIKINQDSTYCIRTFQIPEPESHKFIEQLKNFKSTQIDQVVNIIRIEVQKLDQFCSNYITIHVTLEFSTNLLKELEIQEVSNFIKSMVQALNYLNQKGNDFSQLSINKVLVFPNNQYKLANQQLLTEMRDFERLYINQVLPTDWMIAPEVMKSLRINTPFNNQKASIFNLGIMLLTLLTKTHPEQMQIYDYEGLQLTNNFNEYIELIQQIPISKQLKQLITSFLQINPQNRPTYEEILKQLEDIKQLEQNQLAADMVYSASPKKHESQYEVPPNQIISFNPCYDEVKKVLSESIHRNSPAKQSPQFKDQNILTKTNNEEKKKPIAQQQSKQQQKKIVAKKIYNLENTQQKGIQSTKRLPRK